MAAVRTLDLNFGLSNRFLVLQIGVAALGAAAILASPASWAWKSGLLFVLLISAIALHMVSAGPGQSGAICLQPEGDGRMRCRDGREIDVIFSTSAWVTRWLCVLTVFERDPYRQYHCVICASENDANQYRRLLGYLRLRVSSATVHKAIR